MTGNGYSQYQQNQLSTATPAKLLLAAYDGAIRFSLSAEQEMKNGNFERQNHFINRALAIVYELVTSLREEVEPTLVSRLRSLYAYVIEKLAYANLKQDDAALKEAVKILSELREAWAEAEKNIALAAARKEAA